jgi:hypothetical protein
MSPSAALVAWADQARTDIAGQRLVKETTP